MAILSALTLVLVYFKLPAGQDPQSSISLLPKPIISEFWKVARHPQFFTYAFAGGIASSGLYAYIAGSPFVFMELYGVSDKQYGWIFATIAMGLIIASQVNTFFLRKYTSEQIIRVTLFCQCLAGIALVLGTWFHLLGLYSTIVLILIFLSTQGFAFPNSAALSLAPFTRNAGTASALMGAVQLGIGAIATALVSLLNDNTAMPMAAVMCTCAILSFLILMLGQKRIARKIDFLQAQSL